MMTRRDGGWKMHDRGVIAYEIGALRRLPYLIWSYDYSHASAGPKALHRLCHELNVAGETAYIPEFWATNPDWHEPTHAIEWQGSPNRLRMPEYIAVYPEIVPGNPWNAPHVARWVLNVPGKLGGDTTYAPDEMVFTWDPQFLADVPTLYVPTLETDIYFDRHEPRSGELFYLGKTPGDSHGAPPITLEMRLDRYALADALNHATVLWCSDPMTGMADIARLCGCPVEMPYGRLEPDSFAEEYAAKVAAFPAQLRQFVEITQAVGVPA